MKTTASAILLALWVCPACPAADPPMKAPPDFSPVRELIRTRMTQQGVPSVAVCVARDGRVLWEEGFGWADRERRRPATEHTLYSVASVTKPMTATALMVLVQRGLADLDRPVNDYLGAAKVRAWVGDADAATLRRVANHTSGLPRHEHFFYADEPVRRPDMDETIRRYGNLVRPPGEKYVYSNLGYGLLGHVIARLSKKSYADFMREEVFVPLGMTRASVGIGPGLNEYAATRYGVDGLPVPPYDFDSPGTSAVYCSAHDLVRFGMFHLKAHRPDQRAILSDESIDRMRQPGAADPMSYGIGWFVRDGTDYREVSHGGGMDGASAVLALVPSEGIAVAVLCNSAVSLPAIVKDRVLSILVPPRSGKDAPVPGQEPKRLAQTPQPEPTPHGEWRGSVHTYRGDLPLTLWFKDSGDVHARLGDQLKTLVNDVRLRDGELTGLLAGDVGTEDANRRPYDLRLTLKRRGDRLTGDLIAASRPGKRIGNTLSHPVELKKAE
jgi:CubicO group peptidase (beta-lactamase class C family)